MAKKLAIVFGIVFVIVGLLGFITNPVVGAEGYFVTDAIHNVVHLLVGVVLLIAAGKGAKASSMALKIFGAVYLVLFLNGLIDSTKLLGFITQNDKDTWLHLVLGVVLLAAGFASKGDSMAPMMNNTTTTTM